ncbi:hypothetical protein ACOMHN_012550 [Nucella lapillus]
MLMVGAMAGQLLASSPQPDLKETPFDRLPLNNVQFTNDVLMEVSARSRIECSKKCAETEGCVMCTFHSSPQGPPGHCRLHSQLQTAAGGNQRMPGAKSVALRRHCDGGYVLACGRCLKGVKRKVVYTTAKQDCTDMQGHLVVIKSHEELKCIFSFVKEHGFDRTRVGADDKEEAGVFKWNDKTPLPHISPLWGNGQPNDSPRGNVCVHLKPSATGLFDRDCDTPYQYMCEKETM